jgi:putative phage-type endonuclease
MVMKVVNVSQRSEEWRTWRLQGVSASEAAVIMNQSPYKTPWRLYAEKIGLVLEQNLDNNPLIQAGIRQEPLALQRFEEKHDVLLLPVCGESERFPLMRASFDGLSEQNEPVEVKCPHETTFLDVVLNREWSEAYKLYWHQVQQQLLVSEAERGFLFFYHDGQDVEFEIRRDENFINSLIQTAMTFWANVKNRKEPNKDPERDLYIPKGASEMAWQKLAANYRQNQQLLEDIKGQIEVIQFQQAHYEKALVEMMGDYLAAEHSGVRVNRYLAQGVIDYKAAIKALIPDCPEATLEAYRKPSAQRIRMNCRDDDGKHAEVPFDAEALKAMVGTDYWF